MIDLRQAIKVNKMIGGRHKIGVLNSSAYLPKGTVVLFKDDRNGVCTIETPIDDEWIERNIKENNGIRTINCCVGFPLRFIDEIIL